MNTKKLFGLFFTFCLLFVGLCAFAQSNDIATNLLPDGTSILTGTNDPGTNAATTTPMIHNTDLTALWQSLLLLLISIVTPMLVRLGAFLVPKLPTWTLPIVAPIIAEIINVISGFVGGPTVNPILGALLGSAGVGLREVKDQVLQRAKNGPAVPLILLLGSISFLGLTACRNGIVQVAPGADPITVTAEWTAENGANAFNEFFLFERTHDAGKAVHEFAESLRSTPTKSGIAAQSLIDLRAATETYKKDKTAANGSKVQAALNLVLNLANSARAQMGQPALVLPSGGSITSQLNQVTNGPPANPVSP